MTTWTAGALAISMTGPGGHQLIACAPYGQAGTKEWMDHAKLMAAAPLLRAALIELMESATANMRSNCNPDRIASYAAAKQALAAAGQP